MSTRRKVATHATVCFFLTVAAIGCAKGHDTVLMDAARRGDLVTLRQQIKSGARVEFGDKDGDTALHAAAKHGQVDAIYLLIREGHANPNARDEDRQTPLHLACKRGQAEAARALLLSGADINAKDFDGWTALHFAARSNDVDTCKFLIEKGANLTAHTNADDGGLTPYDVAMDEEKMGTANYLLDVMEKRGINPDSHRND